MRETTLYRWPAAAKFGRVVPKTKFYEHTRVSTAARERFVADVKRITWAYKLADATIHLRGDASVPEIQVFVVDAKAADVGDDVLKLIDQAVKFPVVFEVTSSSNADTRRRMVAAYKVIGGLKPRTSNYYSTPWVAEDAPRAPLPPAVDLVALYDQLLAPILPLPTRPGEHVAQTAERAEHARKLEREIAALERRLRNERQLNRRIELRRQILTQTAAHAALSAPDQAIDEDATWTS